MTFTVTPLYDHLTRILYRYSDRVYVLSSDWVTPFTNDVETFLASFPTFQYRRNDSLPQEFRSNDMYPMPAHPVVKP
jgi:hypothetical protein